MIESAPMQALSFEEACQTAPQFDTGEALPLQPTGHTRLFHHDRPTQNVAVLFHGITNNPLQWEAFGLSLHAAGWNVLIPRLPYHGLVDMLTPLPGKLDAPMMLRYTAQAVTVASGLGERVAVVGLSAGGTYAAWAAQEYPIDRAIVIAPLFGLPLIPVSFTPAITALFRTLPNLMIWWNPLEKLKHIPPHAYPKFSTRNLAETLYLGEQVLKKAKTTPPRCLRIGVVGNAGDKSVSNAATDEMVATWMRQGATVQTHLFSDRGLPHDMIDLTQPQGKTEMVYAKLREMLDHR